MEAILFYLGLAILINVVMFVVNIAKTARAKYDVRFIASLSYLFGSLSLICFLVAWILSVQPDIDQSNTAVVLFVLA